MDTENKQLKIKLDLPEGTIAYYRLQQQWENEGGAVKILPKENLVPAGKLPFTTGDYFRVISGSVDLIDEEFYYIVDVEIITENRRL
jgi:5-hydroxyisourate hydrolase-like protein (transthyretin family)